MSAPYTPPLHCNNNNNNRSTQPSIPPGSDTHAGRCIGSLSTVGRSPHSVSAPYTPPLHCNNNNNRSTQPSIPPGSGTRPDSCRALCKISLMYTAEPTLDVRCQHHTCLLYTVTTTTGQLSLLSLQGVRVGKSSTGLPD